MAEVTIQPKTTAEDPAHVAAMVAKVDGANATARPAWLPEGFDTPEQLAEAYAKVAPKPEAAPVVPPVAPEVPAEVTPPVTPEVPAEAAKAAVENAGLDMSALEAKVVSGEGLSADDYAALEKAGISKAMADGYISGQQALGEQVTARMHSQVGGEEAFNALVDWAANGGLTKAEADAFNMVVDTGDDAALSMALEGLNAKFKAQGGNTPALLGGNRGGATADTYESIQQMMADMRDPRYASDPAFRGKVEQKVSRSSIF